VEPARLQIVTPNNDAEASKVIGFAINKDLAGFIIDKRKAII
jgi:hypothetical protein